MKANKLIAAVLILAMIMPLSARESHVKGFKKPSIIGLTTRMNVNRIDLGLENNGNTGLDGNTFYPNGTNLVFLFAGGPAASGFVNGELRTAWMASASRIQETQAGAWGMPPEDDRARFYEVSGSDDFGSDAYKDWATAVETFGAPFQDLDGDGQYDPNVDRPDILGDKVIYCVYNDGTPISQRTPRLGTAPMGLEVHQTVWAFDRGDALGDVVFFRYRLINPTENDIKDFIFTGWVDPDLGQYTDDLIGSDTTLSLGFIYNDGTDDQYGINPPAFGIDFFQGPIVETGNPTDTAYVKKGPFFGADTIPGWKNLPMTSFMYYIQSDPVLGDPENAQVARNYQEGGLDHDGNPVNPPDWGVGGTEDTDPRFFYSGDPVTGTGWLDATPSDKRFMVNSGPFDLAAGDTQDVVLAYVVGQGADALNSVTVLKTNDILAQASYDNNFKAAPPLPRPKIFARPLDQKIELVIDFTDLFHYQEVPDIVGRLNFEGMEIVQLNSTNTGDELNGRPNAKVIARFDFDDEIGDLYMDTEDGRIKVWDAQSNLDFNSFNEAGVAILRLTIDTDAFTGKPLINFKPYYFTVVPFAVNIDLMFPNDNTATTDDFVLPGGLFQSTRQTNFFSVTPGTSESKPFKSLNMVESTRANAEGWVAVDVIDRDAVTGDDYEVTFQNDGMVWNLVNTTKGDTVLANQTFQGLTGTEFNFPIVDGLSVRVYNVEDRLKSVEAKFDFEPGDTLWFTGRANSGFSDSALFNNGVDFVKLVKETRQDFSDFTPQIKHHEYFPVMVVFDTTETSKAYYWRRNAPDFSDRWYRGLTPTFISAYDISDPENPRKLNVAYNSVNGQLFFRNGNQNMILITSTDYDTTDVYNPNNPNPRKIQDEAYLVMNLELIPGHQLKENKVELTITPNFPNSDLDVFQFSSSDLKADLTLDARKQVLEKVRVVPNPYFAYSPYETSYDTPILKFTHLDTDAEVTIHIFNVAGQLVKTLFRPRGGAPEVSWDLRNEAGLKVASGMYIAHVKVEGVGERILKFGIVQREEKIDQF